MKRGICKDCIHYRYKTDNRSALARFFNPRFKSPFDDLCANDDFKDQVDGSMTPCAIVRIGKCNGFPPSFVRLTVES